jgi:hypothetical protein
MLTVAFSTSCRDKFLSKLDSVYYIYIYIDTYTLLLRTALVA